MILEQSFEQFYNRYFARIAAFSRNLCSCSFDVAEELAQEIITKIAQNKERYDSSYSINTWIYSIARNHCLDWKRKQARRVRECESSQLTIESHYRGPEQQLLELELETGVQDFIDSLEEVDRIVAYLRFYEEMKNSQIAKILEMPSGSIRYRVHQIRKDLSRYLEEHYAIQASR